MSETKDLTTMLHPGEQLRLKRIEFGLDIDDVANELFLSKIQLKALEKGDYESLPGPTYVVGYWRNYAKLLDFDVDEAIEHHRKDLKAPKSGIVLAPNHQQAHGHQEKSRKNSAFLFLFLSLIFLGVIWFWQNPEDNPLNQWVENIESKQFGAVSETEKSQVTVNLNQDSSDQVVQLENQLNQQQQDAVNISEQIFVEEIHPEPNFSEEFGQNLNLTDQNVPSQGATVQEEAVEDEVAQIEAAQIEVTQIVESASVQVPVQDGTALENNLQSNAEGTPSVDLPATTPDSQQSSGQVAVEVQTTEENTLPTVEPVIETQPDPESEAESQSEAQTDTIDTAPKPTEESIPVIGEVVANAEVEQSEEVIKVVYSPNQIILRVDLQTWLDVRDQSGEKLAYKTVSKGEVLELDGSPPFTVFIGAASGVRVEYLGNSVQFEPHKSGLFARFQVGEAQ